MVGHKLLVVDDEAEDRERTRRFLEAKGYSVTVAASGKEALDKVKAAPSYFSVIILDYQMDGMDGADTTGELVRINPDLLILIYSGQHDMDAFLLPFRKGACAFVKKGESLDVFQAQLAVLCAKYDETRRTVAQTRSATESERIIRSVGMVGCSSRLADTVDQVIELRGKKDTVTLMGESGTGKELLAQALHVGTSGPFIALDCGTIHKETAGSTLFGHIKGAYTGAVSDSKGFFRQADGGTRFADEIGELILELQAMVLRAIEQEKVRPMGTNVEIPYHARLIIGAKPTLVEDVRQGKFKLDLLTRLCEAVITVPALRERPEDIGPLVEHFSRKWSERHGVEKSFLASTLPLLERFPWPGNVRELRNLVNAAARFTKGKTKVGPSDVEQTITKGFAIVIDSPQTHGAVNSVEKMTDNYFLEVLGHSTSARDAARKMDVSHSTVARFLQRKGLNPKQVIGINRSGMGKSDRP